MSAAKLTSLLVLHNQHTLLINIYNEDNQKGCLKKKTKQNFMIYYSIVQNVVGIEILGIECVLCHVFGVQNENKNALINPPCSQCWFCLRSVLYIAVISCIVNKASLAYLKKV